MTETPLSVTIHHDQNGTILDCDGSVERLFKNSANQLIGQKLSETGLFLSMRMVHNLMSLIISRVYYTTE